MASVRYDVIGYIYYVSTRLPWQRVQAPLAKIAGGTLITLGVEEYDVRRVLRQQCEPSVVVPVSPDNGCRQRPLALGDKYDVIS